VHNTSKLLATAAVLVAIVSGCASSSPEQTDAVSNGSESSSTQTSSSGENDPDTTAPEASPKPARLTPDGTWELITANVDGEPIDQLAGLFLEVTGEEFSAEGACNTFGGPFDGDIFSTLVGCLDETLDRNAIDERMIEALSNGPSLIDNQLVFNGPGVDLVYQPFDIPPLDQLFAVLTNPDFAADGSELFVDPEAGPLLVDQLSRLDHPNPIVQFYLGTQGDLVSFHWSAENAGGSWGAELRTLSRRAYAHELHGRSGPIGVRVALIPDTVADAPELLALGLLENNVLVLDESVERGAFTVQRPDGGDFVLTVP